MARITDYPAIAYLGPDGSYHSEAASALAAQLNGRTAPANSVEAVCDAVQRSEFTYGLIATETNLNGLIPKHIEIILRSGLKIASETFIRASMNLASLTQTLADITTVYGHPEALAECQGWIRDNLPEVTTIPSSSTSSGARAASQARHGAAAICSQGLAAELGLPVVALDIADPPGDLTRFWLVAREGTPGFGQSKTTVLLRSSHPSVIIDVLAGHSQSINRIVTVTERQAEIGHYAYLVDLPHSAAKEITSIREAIDSAGSCTVLGTYGEITELHS